MTIGIDDLTLEPQRSFWIDIERPPRCHALRRGPVVFLWRLRQLDLAARLLRRGGLRVITSMAECKEPNSEDSDDKTDEDNPGLPSRIGAS
jgi:hypothetical protein